MSKLKNVVYPAALVLSLLPFGVHAAVVLEPEPLQIGAVTLEILAGSQYDVLTSDATGFKLTVPAGETFIVRTTGGARVALLNDIGERACDILRSKENRLDIIGPKTATVEIGGYYCNADDYRDDRTPDASFSFPVGGESYAAGDNVEIFWSNAGASVARARLELSLDGGRTFPTVLADDINNDGRYEWTVPDTRYDSTARLRVKLSDDGLIRTVAVTPEFTVLGKEGTAPAVSTGPGMIVEQVPLEGGEYVPADVTLAAGSIDEDRGFAPPAGGFPSGTVVCAAGLRIKAVSGSAVYYCGKDGKRHAFPNQKVHDSWFVDWNGIVTLTDEKLAAIPLGANMTYRPGVRLVKIQSDPKVYAVDAGAMLRWVPDEWTARALYGTEWNKMIDDVSDALFTGYRLGEKIPATGS